jgi:hypothetical protein
VVKDAVFIVDLQLRRDQIIEKPQLTRPRLLPLDQHPLLTHLCPNLTFTKALSSNNGQITRRGLFYPSLIERSPS